MDGRRVPCLWWVTARRAWRGGGAPGSRAVTDSSLLNPASSLPLPDGTTGEHNFGYNGIGPSTNATLAAWPSTVPIYFSGFELGNPV